MGTTEQKTDSEDATALTIGNMSIEDFFSALLTVLDRRREKGDPHLVDMTVKEFTNMLMEQIKTRSFAAAQTEANVASQILADWQALQAVGAVSQPYRIKSMEDLEELATTVRNFYGTGGKGEFVIAVGIATPEGGYRKANAPP